MAVVRVLAHACLCFGKSVAKFSPTLNVFLSHPENNTKMPYTFGQNESRLRCFSVNFLARRIVFSRRWRE